MCYSILPQKIFKLETGKLRPLSETMCNGNPNVANKRRSALIVPKDVAVDIGMTPRYFAIE